MGEMLRIEVLGDVRVFGPDGQPLELPASRKTRALLAYLAITERPQFREHLCDLLWVGANDPRGALRWSLSRLRAGLDTDAHACIHSDRRTVGLRTGAYETDLRLAWDAMHGSVPPSLERMRSVAALFRGDLLESLDLLEAYRFHAWCAGEREAARSLRVEVLTALCEQVPSSEEALKYAHDLVNIDPLSEASHARVIRLLIGMQRHQDARAQAAAYRHTLTIELGLVPDDVSRRLRRLVHSNAPKARSATGPSPAAPSIEAVPLVGRDPELEALAIWLDTTAQTPPLAVIAGEPGAGKTRLMNELLLGLDKGWRVVRGQAFRAETSRALGPWRDALIDIELATPGPWHDATSGGEPERVQLYDGVLAHLTGTASPEKPLIVAIDDLQWLDEASTALLHYLVRSRPPHVVFIVTMRPEDLVDNQAASQAVASLREAGSLYELPLPPLSAAHVAQLCQAIDPGIDVHRVFTQSEGNPFLATELARALARGETHPPPSVRRLVTARLLTLSEQARELLPWAAALGRTFHIDVLQQVTGLAAIALLERVGELESRGVLEPRVSGAYDFTHDLVRDAAYAELSMPRRHIIHRAITRSLSSQAVGGAQISSTELLRHAELGGQGRVACVAAAEAAAEAQSLCAWVDASLLADRGLQHVHNIDDDRRVELTLNLLDIRISAATIMQSHHPQHVSTALVDVLARGGTAKQTATALYLQSVVQFSQGNADRAAQNLVAAVDAARVDGPETVARQSANTARCLLHIDGDIDKARALIEEARTTLHDLGLRDVELYWAQALLARWDDNLPRAAEQLRKAIRLAKHGDQHWRQTSCLATLIMVTSEMGDSEGVEELTRGALLGDDADGEPLHSPFVQGLAGLADVRRDTRSTVRLDRATSLLRGRRAHAQLAYLLAESARLHASMGQLGAAEALARDAVDFGSSAGRLVTQTDAMVTLAWVHLLRDDRDGARATLALARQLSQDGRVIPARVAKRMTEVAAQLRPHAPGAEVH